VAVGRLFAFAAELHSASASCLIGNRTYLPVAVVPHY